MKSLFSYLLELKDYFNRYDKFINSKIEGTSIQKARKTIREKIFVIFKIIGLIIGLCISFLLTLSLFYILDVNWLLLVVFFGLFGLVIYFPFTRRKLKNLIGVKFIRTLSFLYMMVSLFYVIPVVMPEIQKESEKVRFGKMTDKEKEIYQIQKKLELDIDAQRKIDADRARSRNEQEGRYKSDIIIENKAQRDYYSRMAAPKLIYKCNGSDREIAIAARIGNINRLLNEAEDKCSGRYEIIKRED